MEEEAHARRRGLLRSAGSGGFVSSSRRDGRPGLAVAAGRPAAQRDIAPAFGDGIGLRRIDLVGLEYPFSRPAKS